MTFQHQTEKKERCCPLDRNKREKLIHIKNDQEYNDRTTS